MAITGRVRVRDGPTTLSEDVVSAIAENEGVDPMDLDPPLFDAIDPDALDNLFNVKTADGRVTFSYDGSDVTVTSEGDVRVSDSA